MDDLTTGAIGLADCLGFKGIWRRTSANTVLEALERAQAQTQDVISKPWFQAFAPGVRLHTAFLSDTIVIAATTDFENPLPGNKGAASILEGSLIFVVGW